ncbi:MAG: hypothetical protein Q8J78_07810 [Moraxellaceae bacterium]|nr:hypothetical protein [Moraxellaceae bacterium]
MQPSRLLRPLFAIGLGLLVSACDDESGWPAPTSISGTAAIGAPIVGGTVTLKCRGGVTYTVTTGANGNYTQNIPPADLPCAMRLSGGTANGSPNTQTLHSVSTSGGTTNITPLTDLITALSVNTAAGQTLAAWFANPGNLTQVTSGLAAAQTTLLNSLQAAGFTPPTPFNPLTAPFSPTAGNAYDDLLEGLAAAIAADASVADYSALLSNFLAGGGLPPSTTAEEEEEEEGGGDTDPESAAGLQLVALYAGTYNVTGTTRGTVTISGNGSSIDFDTGKTFSINGNDVYNRIPNFPSEPRVQIELFPQGEAQQRIRIFVDPSNTSVPLSFVYYPSALTDANAITATVSAGAGAGEEEPPTESAILGSSSGISALIGGTRQTSTDVTNFAGPPLSVGAGYFNVGDPGGSFYVSLSAFSTGTATVGQAQSCNNSSAPGIQLKYEDTFYSGMPTMGGSCTLTVTEVTATTIRGTFSGTLGDGNAGVISVQSGEFQYIRTSFAAGGGLPQVAASFEGLTLGEMNNKGDGTGDAGWQGNWISFLPFVTASPELSFTPAGGTALNGGSTAVRIQDFSGIQAEGRQFSQAFNGDVYVSGLFRIDNASASTAQSWITLANAAVYLGLDTSDGSNQFTASLGDNSAQKVRAGGLVNGNQTYLLVARLRKTGGSATYNEIALWVDPSTTDSASPLGTATRTQGTGSLYLLDRLGFRGRQFNNLLIDRIRVSDTWAGIFADPAPLP